MLPSKLALLAQLASFAALSIHAVAQVDFRGFGILPGAASSYTSGVSADGSAVVGVVLGPVPPNPREARTIRWTFTGGPEQLTPPSDLVNPYPAAVSGDGSIIVGNAISPAGDLLGFRWTRETGFVSDGELEPSVVSDDGSYEFGRSLIVGAPYRRSRATGDYELLANSGTVAGSSSDGSFAVGNGAELLPGSGGAWRWSEATGRRSLGPLPAGATSSVPHDVTSDGSVVVGNLGNPGLNTAFRWTAADGYELLGSISGSLSAYATEVAADGRTIVGYSYTVEGRVTATIWLPDGTAHELADYLTSFGAHLDGWTLNYATGISDDGMTIVGDGVNPNGLTEGWVVRIPSPAAGTVILLFTLTRYRRRRVTCIN